MKYSILASLLISILHSPVSIAQDVERISVTATRTEVDENQVNASLFILDSALLEEVNAQHIQQVLSFSPGTWISRGNGQEHLTSVRSPVLTGAGSCGSFFMALDGISLRSPGFCNANQLFDVNSEQASRIEVLRGPASTLYGSNALHGVINVITGNALSSSNSIEATMGANDFFRIETDNSIAAKDSNYRLLFNAAHDGGYQADSGYEQQKLTLIRTGDFGNWSNKSVVDISHLNQETAGFVRGFEIYKDQLARRQNPNPEAFRDAKSLLAYSQFTNDSLTIRPYLRWNEMRFLQHYLPWKGLEENAHSSFGIQAQNTFTALNADWIAGVDIDLTNASLRESQDQAFSPSIPAGVHYDYEVNAHQFGAYLQANWAWKDLDIVLGARAEKMSYDYNNLLADGSACADDVNLCRFFRPSDQTADFNHISPTIELAYTKYQNSRIFIKYTRGFRAPQATELFRLQNNQAVADIAEVKMDAVEFGWRYSTPQHQLDLAIYDMLKEDVIIQDTNRQSVIGGDTSHRGLEASWRWQASDRLSTLTSFSMQSHKYENDLQISRQSIKNNKIDTSPELIASARVSWKFAENLSTHFSYHYMDDYYLNPENSAQYEGHSLVDWSLEYIINDQWLMQANVYNLLDEDYAERADFAFGSYRYFVGQGRRLFLSLRMKY